MHYLYGISNCDKVRAAKKFLANNEIKYEFFDLKKLDKKTCDLLIKLVSFELLVNKKSRTYRALNEDEKNRLETQDDKIILENTSLIKRPILQIGDACHTGFNEAMYLEIFK